MDTVTTLDKGHGRRERRTLKATTALNEYLIGPVLPRFGQVESEVVRDGKTTHEIRYFITSVSRAVADAGQLLKWARGHWSIENRSHYVRDETMGEDSSRIRKRSGPQVMAAFKCHDRLVTEHRRDQHCRVASPQRSQVGELFATGHLQKVISPVGFPMEMDRVPGKISVGSHRPVGVAAGLGRMGIDRNVIHPRFGNFVLLATT